MYESEDRMVSHPDHYISETGMEVIDVIEAFTFDLKGHQICLPLEEEKRNPGFGENSLVHAASD